MCRARCVECIVVSFALYGLCNLGTLPSQFPITFTQEDGCAKYGWSLFELNRDAFLPGWGGSRYAADWWPLVAKAYSVSHAFDVGANAGEYSEGLLTTLQHAEIYMFEGNQLHRNHLAGLAQKHKRLHLVPAAVSNHSGVVQFWGEGTGGRVVEEVADPHEQRRIEEALRRKGFPFQGKVNLTTLSSFVLDGGVELKAMTSLVVKVDTEGHDLNVLRGMRDLLKVRGASAAHAEERSSPLVKVIQAEYNPRAYCHNRYGGQGSFQVSKCMNNQRFWRPDDNMLLQMVTFLREAGYQTFLTGPAFLPLDPIVERLEHRGLPKWAPYLHIGTGDIVAFANDDARSAAIARELSPCRFPSSRVPERHGQRKMFGAVFHDWAIFRLHEVFGFNQVLFYPFARLGF